MHQARYVVLMASVAALGGLLFGYDTGVISGAILFIDRSFSLSTGASEVTVSIVLIGAMLGAFAAGGATDAFGRRRTLIGAGIVFAAGALVSSFAGSIGVLLAGRFVVGVAIGLTSVTAPLYIGEVAPAATRGGLVSLYQWAITIGILGAQAVDYGLAASGNWPLMLGLAIVPSILLVVGMIAMPESPRWLYAHARAEQGRRVIERTHAPADVPAAIDDITRSLQVHSGSWADLFAPPVRPALALGISLAVLQQITGINTVIYYGPAIFKLAGFSSDQTSILATMGVGAVNVLATLIAIGLVDRIGRKPLLYAGLGGMALGLFALAVSFAQPANPFAGPVTIGSLMLYVGCFAFSLGPIVWVIIAEIYPLRVRGRGMAVATLGNWAANFVVSLVFLSMLEKFGSPATFAIYGAMCVVTLAVVWKFVTETRAKELESISVAA